MPHFRTRRRVRHAAAEMFDLVADIEHYPEFVPLCSGMRVRNRTEREDGKSVLVAVMTMAYKLIHQSFTSRATLDRENLTIFVEYLDGPFSRMQNRWAFHPQGEHACEVEFFIDYEFRSRAFALLAGAVFDQVFRRMAAAFEARADVVYGRPTA
jgi:coenzyme Q-binding protein COQ10